MIDGKRLAEIANICLVDHDKGINPESELEVYGVGTVFRFERKKLLENKKEIAGMLEQIPFEFHATGFGAEGWTMRELGIDKNGQKWALFNFDIEHLVVLAIATELGAITLRYQKIGWSWDDSGMVPWFCVDLSDRGYLQK